MDLQYISDTSGQTTAIVIPIQVWQEILNSHSDLKELAGLPPAHHRRPISVYKGILSRERGEAMMNHVEESRGEWNRDI
jgi:hypothetical protein